MGTNRVQKGAMTLGNFPHSMVRLACRKCDRRGQLSRDRLLAEHGPAIAMPDLLGKLADCPRRGMMHDPCGAHYADLVPKG
jgi:hypothetical protein